MLKRAFVLFLMTVFALSLTVVIGCGGKPEQEAWNVPEPVPEEQEEEEEPPEVEEVEETDEEDAAAQAEREREEARQEAISELEGGVSESGEYTTDPEDMEAILDPNAPGPDNAGPVYFNFDRSNIRDNMMTRMNRNAELLAEFTELSVQVEGHCDERGTDEYNMALGQRRADTCKQFLIDYGIDSGRIDTISYGEERPAVAGVHNDTAWAQNRRAVFVVTGQ
jgi:peptidoglycan-associated lipoprotein